MDFSGSGPVGRFNEAGWSMNIHDYEDVGDADGEGLLDVSVTGAQKPSRMLNQGNSLGLEKARDDENAGRNRGAGLELVCKF